MIIVPSRLILTSGFPAGHGEFSYYLLSPAVSILCVFVSVLWLLLLLHDLYRTVCTVR